MGNTQSPTFPRGLARFLAAYREVLPGVWRSPATWFLATLYLLAFLARLFLLQEGLLFAAILLPIYLFLTLLVIPLTTGAPASLWQERSFKQFWPQLFMMILALVIFLATSFIIFYPGSVSGIGGSPLTWILKHLSIVFVVPTYLVILVLSLGILRLLGVPWREMGFGHGYHVWRVVAVLCLIPVILLIVFLAIGRQTWSEVGLGALNALLVAGLPEEIFYRGIVLTRLIRWLGVSWGSALAVLLFGLVHIIANLDGSPFTVQDILVALTQCILIQMPIGLLLTVVFLRTRNLLASVVIHTVLDILPSL